MFDDIDKTIQLAHTPRGAPNFLLALGLCCYTEYWGKLLLGIERNDGRRGEPSKVPFEAFLKRLDHYYYEELLQRADIYRDIRCGLSHPGICKALPYFRLQARYLVLRYTVSTSA
jgi:hypothetical protein